MAGVLNDEKPHLTPYIPRGYKKLNNGHHRRPQAICRFFGPNFKVIQIVSNNWLLVHIYSMDKFNKTLVSVSLTKDQLAKIDQIAAKYECSRSAVVRRAIVDLINKDKK